MAVQTEIKNILPLTLSDREKVAYSFVVPVLNECLGEGEWGTEKRARRGGEGSDVTWIVLK